MPNADINLKRAQANYDLASDYLKQAKQASVVLPLGGTAIKGSV
jgi:hypothetical protein